MHDVEDANDNDDDLMILNTIENQKLLLKHEEKEKHNQILNKNKKKHGKGEVIFKKEGHIIHRSDLDGFKHIRYEDKDGAGGSLASVLSYETQDELNNLLNLSGRNRNNYGLKMVFLSLYQFISDIIYHKIYLNMIKLILYILSYFFNEPTTIGFVITSFIFIFILFYFIKKIFQFFSKFNFYHKYISPLFGKCLLFIPICPPAWRYWICISFPINMINRCYILIFSNHRKQSTTSHLLRSYSSVSSSSQSNPSHQNWEKKRTKSDEDEFFDRSL